MNRKIILCLMGLTFFSFVDSIFAVNSLVIDSSKNYQSLDESSSQSKLVVDKFGNLYTAFIKRSSGADQIWVYTSFDNGRSWNALSDFNGPIGILPYDAKFPTLTMDTNNNILYAFWVGADENHTNTFYFEKYDKYQYGDSQLKFAYYKDGKWSQIQYLTDITGYANWVNILKGNGNYSATNIYVRNPVIGGKLKSSLYYQLYPSSAVDSIGNLYVVWCGPDEDYIGYQIKFMKSSDFGITWSEWKNLTTIQTNANGEHRYYSETRPKIVIDKNDWIWIFYEGQDTGEIWGSGKQYQKIKYMYSSDGGSTFSAPANLASDAKIEKNVDAIVDKNDKLHIVWSGQLTGTLESERRQIRYASMIGGAADVRTYYVSPTTNYEQKFPTITLDENDEPVVFWSGNDINHPVYEDGDPNTDNVSVGTNTTGLYVMKSHYNSSADSFSAYKIIGKGYHPFLLKDKKSKYVNGVYLFAANEDDFRLTFFEDTDYLINSSYEKKVPTSTEKSELYVLPNPFDRDVGNGNLTIIYETTEDADVEISVCDVYGKTVATLVNGSRNAGVHQFSWSGEKDNFSAGDHELIGANGNSIERGVYLMYLKVGKKVQTIKKIFIK